MSMLKMGFQFLLSMLLIQFSTQITTKALVKGFKNKLFLPICKSPFQIGCDGVRNSEPKFSCLIPFKKDVQNDCVENNIANWFGPLFCKSVLKMAII
jgi:hypothetical protein